MNDVLRFFTGLAGAVLLIFSLYWVSVGWRVDQKLRAASDMSTVWQVRLTWAIVLALMWYGVVELETLTLKRDSDED